MTFDEIVTQVLELLQRERRVTYRALKRRFALDDDYLEDLKGEIIKAKRLALDMARLDRLAPVREIAQVGAVLGREFSSELIHAVFPLEEATLQQGLRQLVEAELLYQRGLPPQATYFFKHALIQDTAYQSLLKSRRQQLHQQIVQVLADQFPETVESQPELLAHHCTEAGLIKQALPYWHQAGQPEKGLSFLAEALAKVNRSGERRVEAELYRLKGELTLQQFQVSGSKFQVDGFAGPVETKT
jgi:hypothetical protein